MSRAGFAENYVSKLRDVAVLDLCGPLGLTAKPAHGASGGSFGPCPACGVERRHEGRGDRRLAVGVRADQGGFRCFSCDVAGDAVDLVAWVIGGAKFKGLTDSKRAEVRTWVEGFLGCDASIVRPSRHLRLIPAPEFPPSVELRALAERCDDVTADIEVSHWLKHERALDPVDVEATGIFRSLPLRAACPGWASRDGVFWVDSGHRCLAPLFDAYGKARNVLARRIDGRGEPKSIAASGYARAGLVVANNTGRAMLRGDAAPSLVVIAEGEIDAVSFACAAERSVSPSERSAAIFGVFSGSWTPAHAARIPLSSTVVLAVHHDRGGEKYAAQILPTLLNHTVERWQ